MILARFAKKIESPCNNIFILICLTLYGCGSTSNTISVDVDVLHPAKVNLKEYSRIAIGDIIDEENPESKHPRDLEDQLTSILVSSQNLRFLTGTILIKYSMTIIFLYQDSLNSYPRRN